MNPSIEEALKKIEKLKLEDENFPKKCLSILTPLGHLGLEDFDYLVENHFSEKQSYPPNVFGTPTITLYANSDLFFDINCWKKNSLFIHDHNFQGAFINLEGNSQISKFDYNSSKRLELKSSTKTKKGEGEEIHYNQSTIHLIEHLNEFVVTLLIRSRSMSQNQYVYLYPNHRINLGQFPLNEFLKKLDYFFFKSSIRQTKNNSHIFPDFISKEQLIYLSLYPQVLRKYSLTLDRLFNLIPSKRKDLKEVIKITHTHTLFLKKIKSTQ